MFCSHIQLDLKKFGSLLCFQHFKANGLFFLISSHTKIVFLFFCFPAAGYDRLICYSSLPSTRDSIRDPADSNLFRWFRVQWLGR